MSTTKTTALTSKYAINTKNALTQRYHTSQMSTPDKGRLSSIVSNLVPSTTISQVEEITSTQLLRPYELKLSNGKELLLLLAPSLKVRLLRQEMALLKEQALVLQFIQGVGGARGGFALANSTAQDVELRRDLEVLDDMVPSMLMYSSDTRGLGVAYSILEPVRGIPLQNITPQLKAEERELVQRQLGGLTRALATLKSPSGRFGTASRVLQDSSSTGQCSSLDSKGSRTWSEAFSLLVEGILRDGEDMAVLLPYEVIRDHYQRLSWRLDEVTVPRLVLVDAGSDNNVMATRTRAEDLPAAVGENVRLTGLRNWSQGVFGDPLLCKAFEEPSDAFMDGWREGGGDVIEDAENADTRMLLYRCYRAVVLIVTEHYRPRSEGSRMELEGRRKLTKALKDLEQIDREFEEALKRARSESNAAGVSKRQRLFGNDS